MKAYKKGADGKLAIWASKTYRGHYMPPKEDMLADYDQKQLYWILFISLCSLILKLEQWLQRIAETVIVTVTSCDQVICGCSLP